LEMLRTSLTLLKLMEPLALSETLPATLSS
jgi:hypothetical protein